VFLPELVPLPNAAGSLRGEAVAELVRQQQDLTPVVGLVREHVGEHASARRPRPCPTSARENRDPAIGLSGKRIGEHTETLGRAFFVRGRGLPYRAAVRIEWYRTLQVRGGAPQPYKTAVVKVRKDGSDASAGISGSRGRARAPCQRVKVCQQELIHRVIDGVGFQQDVANLA